MKPYLLIQKLKKSYYPGTPSQIYALRNLSLSVKKGEWVSIVGSNAAGKTSLFNAIAGTLLPDSGTVVLDGRSMINLSEHERAKYITRVKQNPNDGIIQNMTLAENLSMAKLRGGRKGLRRGVKPQWRSEFKAILTPFGIGLESRLDDSVNLLSGGQKQTICLLMAAFTYPQLLLLDEHTAALDPKISAQILKVTENLVRQHSITTLMITHNLSHAIQYGDRLVVLDRGRIVFEATGKNKKSLTAAKIITKIEDHQAELEEDI
jgi:putative ABC transport system ATP-binding protein